MGLLVPNAPCGVESIPDKVSSDLGIQFLMHRVELKENLKETFRVQVGVPNAPCGVERKLKGNF